jgi:NAD(P)-dependent dehydrogenase (short-subunit alcohol dehydrogenase family)
VSAVYPDLKDRSILVTGGGSGIGAAIVRGFARQGSKVAFVDIAERPSQELVRELASSAHQVHFEKCDLRSIPALKEAIERVRRANGPILTLINNAAFDERHSTESVSEKLWDDLIAVNIKHQFFATQTVLPDMQAPKDGVVINLGSISWMLGVGGMPVYTAAKSAVLGLTRALARDYGPYNIRVNAVAPGWIMTERQVDKWLTPEGEAELLKGQCLKRKLYPDDIARFVVFLSSSEASACTNQQYVVDGGWV